jgi:uncharacterized protein YdhG (YjbR/CyaY superfamily)
MNSAKAKPTTIDEYLADATPAQRKVLNSLRRTIHAAAPGAEEYIGYGLAGFKHGGRPLVYFGAWENHCALYAASPKTQTEFQDALKDFEVSKGTIRFTVEKPLPAVVVTRLVRARVAENAAKPARHPASKTKGRKTSRPSDERALTLEEPASPVRQTGAAPMKRKRLHPGPVSAQGETPYEERFKDGSLSCTGQHRNGQRVGEWKFFLVNGRLKAVGLYLDGKMFGEWRWFRENGEQMQTGSFDREVKTGVWRRFHPNGALLDEGEFVNGQKSGEWRRYDAKGKLNSTSRHKPKQATP